MKQRPFYQSISFTVSLVFSGLLFGLGIVISALLLSNLNSALRDHLIEQSQSFSTLSTKPIGDTFLLYQDSGRAKLDEQIQKILETSTYVESLAIYDVTGERVYQKGPDSDTINARQAAGFEPTYIFSEQNYLEQTIFPFIEQNGAHRYTMSYSINSSGIQERLASVRNQILGLLVLAIIATAVLLFFLIEHLLVGPLKRMSRLALAISAGNYDAFVDMKRKDEVRDLGDALNNMAKKLKADIVTLKETDKLKSEFLILTSHNLRTPLTVMNGYLDLLGSMQLDKAATKYVNTIKEHTTQLTDLTNDMLQIAELEGTDKPHLRHETLDVVALLDELRPKIAEQLQAKNQQLTYTIVPERCILTTHRTYVQTAIYHLVDNAHKFTPENGIITIGLVERPSSVEITVKDNGIGIRTEEIQKLFTKFHRGTSTMQYEYEGAGLGLYMTKLMIELLGGSVKASSQSDQGSTFTISLPKR